MQSGTDQLRPFLQAFDFINLLVEGLGWNYCQIDPISIEVDGCRYSLTPVAEKAGFLVFQCSSRQDGNIPTYPNRRKIERHVAKLAYEHLIIFVDRSYQQQVWQWIKREGSKIIACREYLFLRGQSGEHLLQRLQGLAFSLDEEGHLNIPVVASRVGKALDVEKVTKRFYKLFKSELAAFRDYIEGIPVQGDRDWYASLMLNRMMFIYFIQKQGFLDNDPDYLRNRLNEVRSLKRRGCLQQFYEFFLLRLFHEGLGKPEAARTPDFTAVLGKIPYLNGGLFDVHRLEKDNPGIRIPDEAFERVFGFFDSYRWHLDERPHRDDDEINPDVLGYIFEKYVNQKQMGAYYTKEDITGYISRSTVVPFILESTMKDCPVAFRPDASTWCLLHDEPDRYIYPAVGHGITWNALSVDQPIPLETPLKLPDEITAGIDDSTKREAWAQPAPDQYALPNETWREVVARRKQYTTAHTKLANGEVNEINDLVTLNLDIERFASDVVAQSDGPEVVRAFWHAMHNISVLDPTCGSGAFLFAALNVLEPLYTACLEAMRGFLDDLDLTNRPHPPNALQDFRNIVEQLDQHPSQRYFILKSIVLNNLYGVDIMEEAVEICKLRLFLKLVAQLQTFDQIEPLPDIDFNIRVGNTLVGFTSLHAVRRAMAVTSHGQYRAIFDQDRTILKKIEDSAERASELFNIFRNTQTAPEGSESNYYKVALHEQIGDLRDELDCYLAREYDIDSNNSVGYASWRTSHQPFHWFVEFYNIISTGGFDVVIGNPPYVSPRTLSYTMSGDIEEAFPDIYGHILLKSMALTNEIGRCGMIVPLSITFSRSFAALRGKLQEWGTGWLSSFDNIPAALFTGVSQRCTIWLGQNNGSDTHVAPMYRWRSAQRPHLMNRIAYIPITDYEFRTAGIPKLADALQAGLLLHMSTSTLPNHRSVVLGSRATGSRLGFSQAARNFISVFTDDPPCLDASSLQDLPPSKIGQIKFVDNAAAFAALAALSGELFFWYWLVRGDGFDVTAWLIRDYTAILNYLRFGTMSSLLTLAKP